MKQLDFTITSKTLAAVDGLEKALRAAGFTKWTADEGNYARMYINPTNLGLSLEYYNTGNISSAHLDGEPISNNMAKSYMTHSLYLDLSNGKIVEIKEMPYTQRTHTMWTDRAADKIQTIAEQFKDEIKAFEDSIVYDPSAMIPAEITQHVEITVVIEDDTVKIESDYDEDLVRVMHKVGFKWIRPSWCKAAIEGMTTTTDIATEAVSHLLDKGFVVYCKDEEVREKVINGNYEPSPTRVIYPSNGDNLSISWTGYNDDLYRAARQIKGSKWNGSSVVVSVIYYLDIEGFADTYGFIFTPAAQEKINAYKINKLVVTPSVKTYTPQEFDGDAVLKSEAGVMTKHII